MIVRLCGALFLIAGCGGVGFLMVSRSRKELRMLQQLEQYIQNIACDLQYHMASLPQLLRAGEHLLSGELRDLIQCFIMELESQIAPNAACCMGAACSAHPQFSWNVKTILLKMGDSLGNFDLQGQLVSLESVKTTCKTQAAYQENRLTGYARCCKAYSLGLGVILALILI